MTPTSKPHGLGRAASCAQCRAGWNLSYGSHTFRSANRGTAWCETCRSWVPYREEKFEQHNDRAGHACKGSGTPIPDST